MVVLATLTLWLGSACASSTPASGEAASAPESRDAGPSFKEGLGDVFIGFDWPETTVGVKRVAQRKSGSLDRSVHSHYQLGVFRERDGGLRLSPRNYVVDSVTGSFGSGVATLYDRKGLLGITYLDSMGRMVKVSDGSFVAEAMDADLQAKLKAGALPLSSDQELVRKSATSQQNLQVSATNVFREVYPGFALQNLKTGITLTGEYVYALPLGGSPWVRSISSSVLEAPVECPDPSMKECARLSIISTTPGDALQAVSEQLTQILGKPVTVEELRFELKSFLILHYPTGRPLLGEWEEDMRLKQSVDAQTEIFDEYSKIRLQFEWR